MTARGDGATTRQGGARRCDRVATRLRVQCVECERVFDLTDEDEAGEWHYGHDCEATA